MFMTTVVRSCLELIYAVDAYIRKIFLSTNQNVDKFHVKIFAEADPELTGDIGNDIFLNPDVLVSNFRKICNEQLEWSYDKIRYRMSIKIKEKCVSITKSNFTWKFKRTKGTQMSSKNISRNI